MGYTTYFTGEFNTDKEMSYELIDKINKFSKERHGNFKPDKGMPGIWCQWIATDSRTIEWDQGEKFYEYEYWLKYIIENFLSPNGIELYGDVYWQGEDDDDFGILSIKDNKVYMAYGEKTYGDFKLLH